MFQREDHNLIISTFIRESPEARLEKCSPCTRFELYQLQPLNCCYKTSHQILLDGDIQLFRAWAQCPLFAWWSNKAILFYFTQNSVYKANSALVPEVKLLASIPFSVFPAYTYFRGHFSLPVSLSCNEKSRNKYMFNNKGMPSWPTKTMEYMHLLKLYLWRWLTMWCWEKTTYIDSDDYNSVL